MAKDFFFQEMLSKHLKKSAVAIRFYFLNSFSDQHSSDYISLE